MYIAGIITILTFPIWNGLVSDIQWLVLGTLLLIPGGVDGTTQMFLPRESTNQIRGITGLLLGVGIPTWIWGAISTILQYI